MPSVWSMIPPPPKRIAAWASMTVRQRQVWYDMRDAAYLKAWNKWRKGR